MTEKKVVSLNKELLQFIFVALFVSILIVFICNFLWAHGSGNYFDYNGSLINFTYETFFGNKPPYASDSFFRIPSWKIGNEDYYHQKIIMSLKCLILDYKVVLLFTGVLSLTKYILMKVKFEFK